MAFSHPSPPATLSKLPNPFAFGFSSRSLSSGHLLERRVWAHSSIPIVDGSPARAGSRDSPVNRLFKQPGGHVHISKGTVSTVRRLIKIDTESR